jgi:hypothetical protein
MKLDLTKIALAVSILLNVLQTASKEARDWYEATSKQSSASSEGSEKILHTDRISQEITKPRGAE